MRGTKRKMGLWAAMMIAGVCVVSGAQANCFTCGADLTCVDVAAGGRFCVQAPNVCSVVMVCSSAGGGHDREPVDPGLESASLTVLEDAPLATFGMPSRVVRHAGRGVFGRGAARMIRGAGGAAAPVGVLTSMLSFGDGGEVAFPAHSGDGFTLERRRDRRGVHLVVRDYFAGLRGRVLAEDWVGEDDVLLVRVRIDGQPRLLAVQAQALAGFDAQRQSEAFRQEAVAAGAGRASGPALLTPEAVRE